MQPTDPCLKIRQAGCATGEEAYSMAILLKEKGLLDRTNLCATDFNKQSLDVARCGIYSLNHMQTYTSHYVST
ncbi:MAG TPA: protein-glutamate O-methyltransferase CheR, partial [candidate division Zixibacteria bacterium]|nr:protein-glutamate O-methyltransferase CheR [candidate division Zixibacteria bacterium]